MSEALRCRHCGEVIGVYEPLVMLVEGRIHETSRARDPGAAEGLGDHYHRGCHERLDDDEPAGD
jgi:hypothetical protein